MSVQTVTVLYYNATELTTIYCDVLEELQIAEDGRVILPQTFRANKLIVAVLEGECKVLNVLGDRDLLKPMT